MAPDDPPIDSPLSTVCTHASAGHDRARRRAGPARRAAWLFLWLTGLVGIARAADPPCTPAPGVELITRDDLARHVVQRLSDVLSLSTRWHATSLDGYHWSAVPAGLTLGEERWNVYVNGIPVSTRLLGRNQFNAVPISVFDIECVELVTGPDLSRSSFSPSGAIYIHTRRPDAGLSFEGAGAAGNEINDPGPFRYTGEGGENVDRVGPAGAAGISVNAQRWTARASGRLEEFHVTDEALIARLLHMYDIDPKPRIDAASVGFTGSIGPADRRHHLLLGSTRTADLAFFTSVGHEIPTDHRLDVAGAEGRVPLPGGELRYATAVSSSDLSRRPNAEDVDLDWRQHDITADVEGRFSVLRIGGGVRATRAQTDQALSNRRLLTTRLFAGVGATVVPGWRQDLIVEWTQRGESPSAAAYASSAFSLGRRHRIALSGSYGNVLPADQDLWTWLARGYRLPGADSIDTVPLQDEPLPRLGTVDAAWTGDVSKEMRVELRAFFRQSEDDYLPRHRIAYARETYGLDVATDVIGPVEGSTGGAALALDIRAGTMLRQRLTVSYEAVLSGGEAYRTVHERVPNERVDYLATLSPVDRFSLTARLRYWGKTRWPDYESAVRESVRSDDRQYIWEFPSYLLLDISATKRLWRDHFLVSLGLKNVLNEPVRYHPAGAVFNMALHAAVQVNLTSQEGF